METPTIPQTDVMSIARMANVIVGSQQSVLEKLNELYPLEPRTEANPTPKFYSDIPFDAQLNKLVNFNKYKNSHFVYGIMYYYENDTSPERAQMVKDLNLPEEIKNYRIQRVELHR